MTPVKYINHERFRKLGAGGLCHLTYLKYIYQSSRGKNNNIKLLRNSSFKVFSLDRNEH